MSEAGRKEAEAEHMLARKLISSSVSAYSFLPFLSNLSRHHLDLIRAHKNGEIYIFCEGFCSKTLFLVVASFKPHSRIKASLYFTHSAHM